MLFWLSSGGINVTDMSSKALRLLQKEKEKLAPASHGEDEIEECAGNNNARNVFSLVMYKCHIYFF